MPTMGKRHEAFILREGSEPGVRYESGLTIYDEALVDGYWTGRYWSAIGRVHLESEAVPELGPTRELDAPGPDTRTAFRLVVDGEDITGGWIWAGSGEVSEAPGQVGRRLGRHVFVDLTHRSRPFRVRVHTQLDGSPFLVRWLEIINASERSVGLSQLACWSGIIWRIVTTQVVSGRFAWTS